MTYETLQNIYMVTGIASLVMALLSVALFFLLGIPDVIGFLTGKTRRKGIDEIREQSATGGRQKTASSDKKAKGKKAGDAPVRMAPAAAPVQAAPVYTAAETMPLDQYNQTTVLPGAGNQTTVLPGADNLTTVLSGAPMAAPVQQPVPAAFVPQYPDQPFEIEFEITYIHTNEVIG